MVPPSPHHPDLRPIARRILEKFDIILPREASSEAHVLDLGIDPDRVFVRPDVSHLLKPRLPDRPAEWARRVAIVPNARMLDRTEPEIAARYLDYVVIACHRIRAADLDPCILLHETNDDVLVRDLLARLNPAPPVFDEDGVVTCGRLPMRRSASGSATVPWFRRSGSRRFGPGSRR